jgi:hypothetical protein
MTQNHEDIAKAAHFIVTLGRGRRTKPDPDTHPDDLEDSKAETADDYAAKCVAATHGLAGIDHKALAKAIERAVANGDALFVADALAYLAIMTLKLMMSTSGPIGTA